MRIEGKGWGGRRAERVGLRRAARNVLRWAGGGKTLSADACWKGPTACSLIRSREVTPLKQSRRVQVRRPHTSTCRRAWEGRGLGVHNGGWRGAGGQGLGWLVCKVRAVVEASHGASSGARGPPPHPPGKTRTRTRARGDRSTPHTHTPPTCSSAHPTTPRTCHRMLKDDAMRAAGSLSMKTSFANGSSANARSAARG
eukprot:scaffold3886_cov82-Isochrysis_galbana.AAC.2